MYVAGRLFGKTLFDPLVPGPKQHGIHEQQHRRFGKRPIVRILGKADDVSLPEGLMNEEGLLHEDVLRVGPDEARGNQLVLGGIDATLRPLSSLMGANTRGPSIITCVSPSLPAVSQ
jgi:hypothetical protein